MAGVTNDVCHNECGIYKIQTNQLRRYFSIIVVCPEFDFIIRSGECDLSFSETKPTKDVIIACRLFLKMFLLVFSIFGTYIGTR